MARSNFKPEEYPPFAALPVTYISGTDPKVRIAVHISGRFTVDQPPLICLAGYHRNMTDYADFLRHYRAMASIDWPIVLVDLAGRGRSSYKKAANQYSTLSDAEDLATVARAIGISRATFIGQGHGGQVVMALAAQHAALVAGVALINAGPSTNPRGLLRLKSNLQHIAASRGVEQAHTAMRQILRSDYPALDDEALDRVAARTHRLDDKGRVHGLFDPALLKFLEQFQHGDVFEPQWQLFDALRSKPLMLIRSRLTDRLDQTTFQEMLERRPDAISDVITAESSPVLLNNEGEVGAIADFVSSLYKRNYA